MKKLVLLLVIMFMVCFVSCETEGKSEKTQAKEVKITEEQHTRLMKSTPPPTLEFSLERENLKERLVRFNDANKVSYIYLVSYGKIMAHYVIKGKVSSVNSKLTTGEQIVQDPYAHYEHRGGKVVESPQLDGSYGMNGDAVFFFTTDNIYVEWNGEYMLCDQPLKLTEKPTLVYEVK